MQSNYNMKRVQNNNFLIIKPPIIKDNDYKFEYSSYKNCYFETIKNWESKKYVLTRFLHYYENDILYTLTQNKFPLIVQQLNY